MADGADATSTVAGSPPSPGEVDDMGRGEDQSAAARAKISQSGVSGVGGRYGEPVSIACNTVPVTGMVRIGPGQHVVRGRGTRRLRQRGHRALFLAPPARGRGRCVVLFTDLANPVSNSIYQRIGYRPACEDRVVLAFLLIRYRSVR